MDVKQYDFYYELRSLPFVEAIWLYGSRARRENKTYSDIDLAIICPKATSEDWKKVQDIVHHVDTIFHIDVIRFDALKEEDRIRENILNDNVILFEKKLNSYPWYDSFLDLGEALERLKEMVKESEMEKSYVKDATIHCFDFCFELFWKTLKRICIYEGYEVTTPRSVLEKTLELNVIQDNALWTTMLEDRHQTSHTYKRKLASAIYYRIKNYYPVMEKVYVAIKEKYKI